MTERDGNDLLEGGASARPVRVGSETMDGPREMERPIRVKTEFSRAFGDAAVDEPGVTIVQFLNMIILTFLAPMVLIWPAFLFLKGQHYELISQSQSDQMISWAKFIWPVIASQYSYVERVDPMGARFYALLAIVSLGMMALLSAYSIVKFLFARKRISVPGTSEYLTSVLAPVLYFVFAFLDSPRERYTKGFFWVDDFGAYYVREYAIVLGVGAAVLIGFLTILKIIDQIASRKSAMRT